MSDQENSKSDSQSFAERFAKKPTSFSGSSISANKPKQNNDTALSEIMKQHEQQNISNAASDLEKLALDELARRIYLVKGVDAGRNAWYYVLVEKLKIQLFLKALNDDIIHLENYGKILYSGYGDEPPTHITDALKSEYGIK